MREFSNRLELVTRLEPRDAFFGGRTNAVQLYRRAQEEEGEKIGYVDYTSLYTSFYQHVILPSQRNWKCSTTGCIDGVFRVGEMYLFVPLQLAFCHFTLSMRKQVDVSPVKSVRGGSVTVANHPENLLLPSHGRGTRLRLRHRKRPRSVALFRSNRMLRAGHRTWVRRRRNVEAYEQKEGTRATSKRTLQCDLWPR